MLVLVTDGILPAPMSTSAAIPSAFSLPGGAGLLALVERVFSLVTRERMTAQERALIDQVRELSGSFGAYILEAEDRDDLITRIDAVLGDPRFHAAQRDVWEGDAAGLLPGVAGGFEEALDGEEVPDAMVQALGPASTPFLHDLHRNLSETIRCLEPLLEKMPPEPEASPALETFVGLNEGGDPLAFISAPEVPVPVAEALLASLRLNVLILVPITLLFQQGSAGPWLKLAIAELLASSSRRSLALTAALSGTEVSVDLLPMDERLDLTGLDRHSKAVQAAYARFNMAAERSGEPVFPSSS
ncbi:hypothetical protein [Corallococcus exercitus]|uniref:Uncharacterized protein n=1 Tax=Corallococcus exercitus TaxID=2316736 RepID=A0A7Y4JPP9_9BACT|nr:hypothetical protein [Corallococcus exercitus]NOK08886.1 hypothetical protein [Corallococcus exercitus]